MVNASRAVKCTVVVSGMALNAKHQIVETIVLNARSEVVSASLATILLN